jgi:hypothetical protein
MEAKQLARCLAAVGLCMLAAHTALADPLVISEFRVRGPNGANDEFVEVYNTTNASHTVAASSGTGYAVAASDGVVRFTIPNGTVIPAHGHYLGVNSVGYSLASYPAGNGATATSDATWTTDIPDNAGIALFTTDVTANFSVATRMDAVGSTSEANTLYKEGTGYPALTPFSIDYAFYRDQCGKGGSITTTGPCPTGAVADTGNNAADFVFVDTNGTSAGAGQRLGAPGPQNLSSPINNGSADVVTSLDTCAPAYSAPNQVRDFTSDPANNSTFGTVDLRFTYTNNSGANLTRLRFRVVDLTTFPAPSGIADLRPRTSTAVVVTVDRPPCGSGTSNITVQGTTLEQPPSQPNGGGFNSSLSVDTITLATPLANGASVDLRVLNGIQQTGAFRIGLIPEGLTQAGTSVASGVINFECDTDAPCAPATHFAVSAPSAATAGSSFNFTVTALDATNATVTGYTGTVHFTSSDAGAGVTLPANATLTNGTGTFSATLTTAGNQTLTASDTVSSSITGTSNAIAVSAAAATHFSISAPASATAGTALSFTVTALDQFNNVATGYAGTVHFTSTDTQAVLPADSTLTNGAGTFSATLKTPGNQTLTATDTVNTTIVGTSNAVAVQAAPAATVAATPTLDVRGILLLIGAMIGVVAYRRNRLSARRVVR